MTMIKKMYQSRDAILKAIRNPERNPALTARLPAIERDALRIESALGLVLRLDEVAPFGGAALGNVFEVKFLREAVSAPYVLDVDGSFPFLRAMDQYGLLPKIEGDYATISIAFKAVK